MLRGKTAYIVDDDNLIRSALKNLLTELGMLVLGEAEDTRTVLETLKFHKYDLLILDIHLPGENGIELLRKLRETHPKQKVLMVTSEPTKAHVEEAIGLGIQGFIAKPFNMEKIQQVLEKCLSN